MSPSLYTVRKLLMLKLLLAYIVGILARSYDFGYHPSAEEFDNLRIGDRARTWTRDLLASQRRNDAIGNTVAMRPLWGTEFVPKFSYERERERHANMMAGQNYKIHHEPQLYDINYNHSDNNEDQQSAAASMSVGVVPSDTVFPSSLEFNMFSDEVLTTQPTSNRPLVFSNIIQTGPRPLPPLPPQQSNGVTIIEIASSEISNPVAASGHKQPPIPTDNSSLPIFFTNPATGVVYAITEIGRVQGNVSTANGSIPIYITKEQYNRDLEQLHAYYQRNCRRPNNQHIELKPSSFSSAPASPNTTVRPQIIHLPTATLKPTISKLPTFALPVAVHQVTQSKPSPAVAVHQVKQAPTKKKLNITTTSSSNTTPIKKQSNRKRKRKNKKSKPPGSRPPPMMATLGPNIVRGTRTKVSGIKPSASTPSLHTQLEKPNLTASSSTIFSDSPFVSKFGYMSAVGTDAASAAHHRGRRSTKTTTQAAAVSAFKANGTKMARHTVKTPKRRKTQRRTNTGRLPQPKDKTRGDQINRWHNALMLAHIGGRLRNCSDSALATVNCSQPTDLLSQETTTVNTATTVSRSKKLNRPKTNDDSNDEGVDLLDFFDDFMGKKEDTDESDSKSYDDSYYDDSDDDVIKYATNASTTTSTSMSGSDDESSDNLHEDITQSNSSSAEESADFGALEEDQSILSSTTLDDDSSDIIWTTKNTVGKKRIRRRPPAMTSASKEDYDDDDGGGGGGISNFFRMIFYPVQAVMSKLFSADDDDSEDGDEYASPSVQYPTYTLYHNSLAQPQNAVSDEQATEEQSSLGSSINDWFSSWFGFNRRTKNIGSTTKAPPIITPQGPPPTRRPQGWLESWLGFGITSNENDSGDDYDKWFASWFETKPKARRHTTTTTTPSAPMPQVPILTIVDPLKNPQNWIGILAHHLANSTSTTTHKPLAEVFTRATTIRTTTENPDIPRHISYDKYQIWRLKPQDNGHIKILDDYKRGEEGVKMQWLRGPSLRGLNDVLVSPKMLVDFRSTLAFENIAYEVLIFDVGKAIAYESKETFHINTIQLKNKTQTLSRTGTMNWYKYHDYDNIIKYLERLRIRHPQFVELVHIGRSYEGRPLIIVKLELDNQNTTTSGQNGAHKKLKHKKKSGHTKAVFIEAGTHGVEWIGPATATWIINELLHIMRNNKTSGEHDFIRKTTWYIMPVLNPDGYSYTHEYDRFWRKTRSRHVSRDNGLIGTAMNWLQQKRMHDKICYGVDLDRNWAYQWDGSESSPCNEFYTGPTPFSEPETKSLSEFLIQQRKHIKLYISLQAYGQVVSFPMRMNGSFNSERTDDFLDVAMVGIDGLRKKGSKSRYKMDTTSDLIEHRAGCSDAFAAYEVGVPFSFTIQLADNGVHGYLLPGSSIEPTARDTFEIITAMVDYI